MSTQRNTRILFLDDSGKPSAADTSKAVVIGGFSIPSQNVRSLDRRIAGAKARFYPGRGDPGKWELKAQRTINPNPWNRSKNRNFVKEVLRILGQLDATVYTVTIDKRRLHHEMTLDTTTPLQLQAARGALRRGVRQAQRDGHDRVGLVQPFPRRPRQRVCGHLRDLATPPPAPQRLLRQLQNLPRDPSCRTSCQASGDARKRATRTYIRSTRT